MYISPASWKAVKNLKEKNLQIINQIGQQLPAEATGLDLQKAIMQYLMTNPTAVLHELVSEALSYEAKQLL
jgi:predicted transcriptional regulator